MIKITILSDNRIVTEIVRGVVLVKKPVSGESGVVVGMSPVASA